MEARGESHPTYLPHRPRTRLSQRTRSKELCRHLSAYSNGAREKAILEKAQLMRYRPGACRYGVGESHGTADNGEKPAYTEDDAVGQDNRRILDVRASKATSS